LPWLAALAGALLLISLLALAKDRHTAPPTKHVGPLRPYPVVAMPRVRYPLDDTYLSTDVPKTIPDLDSVESVLAITSDVTVERINVYVAISHGWMRDLVITLFPPWDDTTGVTLLRLLPWDAADTLEGWFDDGAAISIMQADTPIVAGTWRPVTPLSGLAGHAANGTWRLRIRDQFRLDSGYVGAWGIEVNPVVRLSGTILNAFTRAPVENMLVTSLEDNSSTRTARNGTFAMTRIGYGTRTIQLWRDDYDTLTVPGVVIQAGDTARLDTIAAMLPRHYEFVSTSAAVAIPDTQSAQMDLLVNKGVVIDTLTVTININHTYIHDLIIRLKSPKDSTVLLANQVGGEGQNFVECTFDDQAMQSIRDGAAPFTGHYRPERFLSSLRLDTTLIGSSSSNIWTLAVRDTPPAGDVGTIENFTLHIVGHLPDSRLIGVIRNQFTRAPIANATVELLEHGLSYTTGRDGSFVVNRPDSLPQTVRISKSGYDTLTIPNVTVAPHTTVSLDTALTMPAGHFEFDSPSGSIRIPDDPDSLASMVLTVNRDVIVDTLYVAVDLTHPRTRDLTLWLKSPRDSVILLASAAGGDSADYTHCVFDDNAGRSIENAAGPLTGRYRPLEPLSFMNNDTARGSWTLMVRDSVDSLAGRITGFSLHIIGRWVDLAVDDPRPVPQAFEFLPNFPNPFNSRTEFRFTLPSRSPVSLVLYNVLGQQVAEVTQQLMEAGSHRVSFDGAGLTSGIYFARLQAAGTSQCRKIVLLR
jgi:subtilisin-like proprotein convertase family protein